MSKAVLTSTLPMLSLVLFWVLTLERIQARVAGARPMSQALSLRWCHTGKVLPLSRPQVPCPEMTIPASSFCGLLRMEGASFGRPTLSCYL